MDYTLNSFAYGAKGFDLQSFLAERPYPRIVPATEIRIKTAKSLDAIFDWCDDPEVERLDDEHYLVIIKANEM